MSDCPDFALATLVATSGRPRRDLWNETGASRCDRRRPFRLSQVVCIGVWLVLGSPLAVFTKLLQPVR